MSYESEDKMVSHPDHYKSGKYEVIDIIDEFTKDLSGTEAVCTANAIKYILRWKKKGGYQDIEKAIWYLQHMLDTCFGTVNDRELDLKNDETLYSLRQEGEPQGGYTIEQSTIDKAVEEQRKHRAGSYPWGDGMVSIDDEPEPLGLRKNAAGVYIPHDPEREIRSCKNCEYGYISSIKDCTYGPCVGHAGNHNLSVGFECKHWELKKEEE